MDALLWQDKSLSLLDQSKYPQEVVWHDCNDFSSTLNILKTSAVSGDSILAVAASYAYCLAALEYENSPEFHKEMTKVKKEILAARPNCVAIEDAIKILEKTQAEYINSPDLVTALLATGVTIHRQDVIASRAMNRHGRDIIPDEANIVLSCRGGIFHTGSMGSALGIISSASTKTKLTQVFVCENRPNLEGSLQVAHELAAHNINTTVIADHTASSLMPRRSCDVVLIEGLRLAANGDLLAGPGTYELAISAYFHSIPVYATVYTSSIDMSAETGDTFPQEDADATALSQINGKNILPEGVSTWAPAYDVLPHYLLTGLITEKGLAFAPFAETIPELMTKKADNHVVMF